MPHGILTRRPHTGFRSGAWMTRKSEHLAVQFGTSWDLARATTGFPMVSCVVHGARAKSAVAMGTATEAWSGYLSRPDIPWAEAEPKIAVGPGTVSAHDADVTKVESPYKSKFRQGAVLSPQMTVYVQEVEAGPLGVGAGRVSLKSLRTTLEKEPWKSAPSLTATVESSFVRPTFLGSTILPFRTLEARKTVLALDNHAVLTDSQIADHPGLSAWWDQAESTWEANKSESDGGRLLDRIDFHGQLSAQLPIAPIRVVYTKAGNTIAAAVIRDPRAIVDTSLYWAPVSTESEALYLCAVLNSTTLLERVKPLQTLGLFGARHFDKYVFAVPFPKYDGTIASHAELAGLGKRAEAIVAGVDVSSARTFQAARKLVAAALVSNGVSAEIESAVAQVLPEV